MICLTIFSILLPIGVQPQIEFNYAFAEINSQSINDNVENSDEGKNSSYSSTSESRSKLNFKNPFGFADNKEKKVKTNIILPDIVEPDIPVAEPSSTTGSDEIGTQSNMQDRPNSVDKSSSSNNDNTDVSVIEEKEKEGKPTTIELSPTDSQAGTFNNNEDNNVNDIDSIVSDDKPSTEISQSELGSQPKYKSYRDYVNNNSNSEESVIESDDKPGAVLSSSSRDAQINTAYSNANNSNANNNTNGKANKTVSVTENQTATTESESTTSSESQPQSQPQSGAQPKYKSYRDFIENSTSNSDNSINVTDDAHEPKLNSTDSQSGTVYGNINVNINKTTNTNTDNINNILLLEKSTSIESSSTSSSQSAEAESSNEVYGDFNGDGFDDLAIGVIGEDLGSIFNANAGAVEVIYGSSNGLSATLAHADQFWTQDSANIDDQAETGDQFGRSLAIGDFNDDGFDDLAIGVPLEDSGSVVQSGGVEVIYGSSSGLSATLAHADQFWTQNSADVEDSAEASDLFGSSLTAADFNADGKDDLAIGVPGEAIGSIHEAGGVEVIYGSSSGLSATFIHADEFWTQDSANIDNQAETADQFGSSLTAADFNADGIDDLAIGVPFEGLGSISHAGGVEVIYGFSAVGLSATLAHADQFWTQDSTDIDNQAEDSDQFGFSLTAADFNADGKDDLAIGVPFEWLGSIGLAGAVEVIYGSSNGLSATLAHADQFWTQDSANIDNQAENSDQFGTSVTAADFNADSKDDLAIGVPHEDSGAVGAVQVIYGSSSGLSATSAHADQFWTQDSTDIENQVESGDLFGQTLAIGDFNADGKNDLAVGVPFEDLGSIGNAGGVEVIYGSSSGLSATSAHADQFWTQDSANIDDSTEEEDLFGFSLE